jgi:hypothetical protein
MGTYHDNALIPRLPARLLEERGIDGNALGEFDSVVITPPEQSLVPAPGSKSSRDCVALLNRFLAPANQDYGLTTKPGGRPSLATPPV